MKNKDLPAHPVMPFKNQFGQDIILSGFSKHEFVALQIYLKRLSELDKGFISTETFIEMCFEDAEKFCNYITENSEKKLIE